MLCDIGNGTMNIMFVNDKKPNPHRCFTEKFGTHQCMLHIRENLMRIHHAEPPEEMMSLPGMKDELRRPMMLLVRARARKRMQP